MDGSYVCPYCGIVQDTPCLEYVLEFRDEDINGKIKRFIDRMEQQMNPNQQPIAMMNINQNEQQDNNVEG